MDCGPTCIRIIARYYGKRYSLQTLRERCQLNREGVSLLGISEAATQIGFRTVPLKTDLDTLYKEQAVPCIAHWRQNHFVVVFKITKKYVWVSDPAKGIVQLSRHDFLESWVQTTEDGKALGVVLLMEPTVAFFQEEDEKQGSRLQLQSVGVYFLRYRKLFVQLLLGLLVGNALQLFLPFLTQGVVDVGIATKDMQFIYLLLIGQLMLFVGSTMLDFMRSWILLHISTRINISLLSDFLVKLMKLPLSYFDTKMLGDIMQRMNDHKRIETFLTGSTINTIFSIFNFIVFTFIIVVYDVKIFLIFLAGNVLYFAWVYAFMKFRRKLDFKQFELAAKNQSTIIQLINGMQEIKMNDCAEQKRWGWEHIQAKLFKLNIRSLSLNQFQQGGASFINQAKNIIVTFYSAKAVVDGNLTLGGMMAVQYIIGQLNAPIQQFILFMQAYQDARISLERINEIHEAPDEEPLNIPKIRLLPRDKSITIRNLQYKYVGYDSNWVLNNINFRIPYGKTTAIVGMSGSGKTTLLKLLLKFYDPANGEIRVSDTRFDNISSSFWRSRCGVVMQDGFIFSDTIVNNIAVKGGDLDWDRLMHAAQVANIHDMIAALPLGFNTMIGAEGNGLSQGQKQRILIARAVYKDPDYIFFDEATNSLDANNERVIMDNLQDFFQGRTVVVVAHRLSTVRNADQIVVLHKGEITEIGNHDELIRKQGSYFELVRNQLELGN